MINNILETIKNYKLEEIKNSKLNESISSLELKAKNIGKVRPFKESLLVRQEKSFAIIAEIKKASPSKGLIKSNFSVPKTAKAYELGGAACLSVLTDAPSFQGKNEFLEQAKEVSSLPVLRKDFLYDPYQVVQSRTLGADCILIIMASVTDTQAEELESTAFEWGMDVLLEVHNTHELKRALKLKSNLIGINNRDLKTFQVNLETTEKLVSEIPQGFVIVSESGFKTSADLVRMSKKKC